MEKRKRHSSGFKAQVALEAIQNQRTIAQIASEYKVPSQSSDKMEETTQRRIAPDFRRQRKKEGLVE